MHASAAQPATMPRRGSQAGGWPAEGSPSLPLVDATATAEYATPASATRVRGVAAPLCRPASCLGSFTQRPIRGDGLATRAQFVALSVLKAALYIPTRVLGCLSNLIEQGGHWPSENVMRCVVDGFR